MFLIGNIVTVSAKKVQWIMPDYVKGVKNEVISLNGNWDFQFSPKDKWEKVTVPGELAMQGYGILHDTPVMYRKNIHIPSDYKNKDIILRFDGVYSYARLWINDKLINEHKGGFTRWETNITNLVKTGQSNEIKLEVTDKINDISYASGYAHHPIGGILRDVHIYALPKNNISNFFTETLLDDNYKNADLRISYNMHGNSKISFKLKEKKTGMVVFENNNVYASEGENEYIFKIINPLLWDAEHPNLYVLKVEVTSEKENYYFEKEIGFRKIEIKGNKMFVNGKQVKLRGACRHDIHPTLGRTTNNELDSIDVMMFKKSNMNFVRTSHYPPSENFLKYCDRKGLYVECETAICFVDTYRQKNYAPGKSQNDDAYTDWYLGQLEEMVITSRSHSCVLFWSIGNESSYGKNFQLSYDWLKNEDKTRPVIFSYPGLVDKGKNTYDIISMHYPAYNGSVSQFGISINNFHGTDKPALFDEWAHVPCYTYTTLQDDPNIREFWAMSLDMMWNKLFVSPGGLGGAIWCYSDETFMLPEPRKGNSYWIEFAYTKKPKEFNGNCVGYGEWGIVDVWRREKPEFWGTKKAYSPVKVLTTQIYDITEGMDITLPVFNRYDHTNLNEISVKVSYKGRNTFGKGPDIMPHNKGILTIPGQNWENGTSFLLEFIDKNGSLIDAENITLGNKKTEYMSNNDNNRELTITDEKSTVIIKGDDFEIPFSKITGLMENVKSKGNIIIEKGPFLNLDLNFNHLTGAEVREKARNLIVEENDWIKSSFSCKKDGVNVKAILSGKYKGISVTINILVQPSGEITLSYNTEGEPNGWLRESGLKFYLTEHFTSLEWERKGYWTYYPDGNFAGNKGKTKLYNKKKVKYGEYPDQDWNMDTYNYYYFSNNGAICENPLTNKAKGMKENIYKYKLFSDKSESELNVISANGELGCRINKINDGQLLLYINNRWDYPEIAWGDYCKALEVKPVYGNMKIHL